MATNNHLTLAVAGSRKTQSIVDACAASPPSERILVLTYTTANQVELRDRLDSFAGDRQNVEVRGWFSFLLGDFVRPFLPFSYPDQRVKGFDFEGPPQQYANVSSWARYFNQHGEARKVHLPQLALRVHEASSEAPIRRLERMYDRIFIDEVQDLCGYDLEVLKLLMASSVRLEMVGDIRQAILATNAQEKKNKKFMYMEIWNWFRAEESAGRLAIEHRAESWRCRPEIAALADSLFGSEWGFPQTTSKNEQATGHDGVFLVSPEHVDAYVARFDPLPLRHSKSSGKQHDHLEFMNIGKSKGLGRRRVLVCPTKDTEAFITTGKPLTSRQAASFYVAITRAEQSVALIIESPGKCQLPVWTPQQ